MKWVRPYGSLASRFVGMAADTMDLRPDWQCLRRTPPALSSWVWPADLADWVAPAVLVDLALEASQSVEFSSRSQSLWTRQACNPRVLLSIYLYGFCRGIYASTALTREIFEDPALRYLSVRHVPTGELLRRFRRAESAALRQGLESVLAGAFREWQLAQPLHETSTWRRNPESDQPAWISSPREEANVRLLRAVRWDSMDSDF